jgi:hypothetical protein
MSLIATRVQNWRIENPELDRNMFRPCEYGALDFFIEQTNAPNSIISPNLRDRALASIGNTVQVPVINYDENVQVSNVRSCVIADNENTSALVTLVWTTYAIGFTMVPGRIRATQPNAHKLVGFEIIPVRAMGVTAQIHRVGLQMTGGTGIVKLYLFHSSQIDPVFRNPIIFIKP